MDHPDGDAAPIAVREGAAGATQPGKGGISFALVDAPPYRFPQLRPFIVGVPVALPVDAAALAWEGRPGTPHRPLPRRGRKNLPHVWVAAHYIPGCRPGASGLMNAQGNGQLPLDNWTPPLIF